MSEIITTYLLDDLDQPIPMDRTEFYDSQIELAKKGEKPNRAIGVAQILLFTQDGDIIIQKRSRSKKHNPEKLDKTVGGHIVFGDSPSYTVMAETLQEMSIPAFVLNSEEDFRKTFKLLSGHLSNSALIQFIDSHTDTFIKEFSGHEKVSIINKYYFYIGVYNGSIRPADKEAAGILFYNFDQLKKEITENPQIFTSDLKFFIDKYNNKINKFLTKIK